MKRVLIPITILVVAVGSALAWKIQAQEEALQGPTGGSGIIEATSVDLSARVAGRVTHLHVSEGAAVNEGDLLVELECSEPEAALAEAQARAAASRSQAQAAGAQAQAARQSGSAAQVSASGANDRTAALAARQEAAERDATRVESLGEHASLSRRDQVRAAADGLSREVSAARASQRASRIHAQALRSQGLAAEAQAEAAARGVEAIDAAVTRAQLLVDECRILAPRDGIVERLFFEEGELPRPGATLVRIVDLSEMTATFYVPNAELGAVSLGQNASLVADAFPDSEVEGRVVTISNVAEFTPRNIQTRTDRDRLVYAVEVRVDNSDGAVRLRPGMPVQVHLVSSSSGDPS